MTQCNTATSQQSYTNNYSLTVWPCDAHSWCSGSLHSEKSDQWEHGNTERSQKWYFKGSPPSLYNRHIFISLISSLKIEVTDSSKTLVPTSKSTQSHNPEHHDLASLWISCTHDSARKSTSSWPLLSSKIIKVDTCFIACYNILQEIFICFFTFKQIRSHRQAIFFLFLCQKLWHTLLRHASFPNNQLKYPNMRHKKSLSLQPFHEQSTFYHFILNHVFRLSIIYLFW